METDTETTNPERLPHILSSFQPGQRIEVWTMVGESFEAEFVSFDSQTLVVRNKAYRRAYQRSYQNQGDQLQYGLAEIARVRVVPPPKEKSSFGSLPTILAVGAVAALVVTFVVVMVSLKDLGKVD
jgi:hypothetical protein